MSGIDRKTVAVGVDETGIFLSRETSRYETLDDRIVDVKIIAGKRVILDHDIPACCHKGGMLIQFYVPDGLFPQDEDVVGEISLHGDEDQFCVGYQGVPLDLLLFITDDDENVLSAIDLRFCDKISMQFGAQNRPGNNEH